MIRSFKMIKDPRVKQAMEMLNVLEENNNRTSNLVGGFIAICVGTALIQQVANNK